MFAATSIAVMSRIAYEAHTEAGSFLLDEDGICRVFVPAPSATRGQSLVGHRSEAADRCIGAQFVASLDASEPGILGKMPKVGAALLFGLVDGNGRIVLVRTGPLLRFETLPEAKPGTESDKDARAAANVGSKNGDVSERDLLRLAESDLDMADLWEDESTASAVIPFPVSALDQATLRSRAIQEQTSKRVGSIPATYELSSEPATLRFRAADLLRRSPSEPPRTEPSATSADATTPMKRHPSIPYDDESLTPAGTSVRRAIPLGAAARLVEDADEAEATVESARRSGRG